MEYVTRHQWGARPPTSIGLMSGSLGMAVHWTAGPTTQTVRQIQDFHMDGRGWTDIAYSWLVDVRGTIYEGRGWGRTGAHTQGFNSVVHAVCVIADADFKIGPAAEDAVRTVIEEHDRRYGRGYVRPHRDFPGASTACPGDKMAKFARTYEPDLGGFTMAELDTIAGWFHDTRKLILAGQVRAEEMHREAMVAEWRTRKVIRGDIAMLDQSEPTGGTFKVAPDDPDRDLIIHAEGADFIASEGAKQLRELDEDPATPAAGTDTPGAS